MGRSPRALDPNRGLPGARIPERRHPLGSGSQPSPIRAEAQLGASFDAQTPGLRFNVAVPEPNVSTLPVGCCDLPAIGTDGDAAEARHADEFPRLGVG